MKNTALSFLSCLCLVGLMAVQGEAATISAWDVSGLAASQASAPVTTEAAGTSSSDLTVGPRFSTGIGWPDAVGSFAESWRLGPALANAISLGSYFSFTVTPDGGSTIDFDSIDARLAVNTGSTFADVTFDVMSDVGGFAFGDPVLASTNIVDNTASFVPVIHATNFDLSGAGLTGISAATEFRIYVSSVSGNRIGIGHTFSGVTAPDDLIVNGTVSAVPEPTTIGMLLLGVAGTMLRRRS